MAQKPIDKARNQGTERGTAQQKVLDELNQGTPAGIPQRVATNTDPTKPVTPQQLEPIAAANSNEAVKPLNQGAPATQATPASQPQGLPNLAAGRVAGEVVAATFDTAVAPNPAEMTRSELDAYRQQRGLTPEQKKEADAIAFKWMEGSMPQQKGQFPGAVDPNSAQYAQNQQSTYQALTQRAATQGLTTSEKASMLGGDFAYRISQGTPGMPGAVAPGTSIASRLAASPAGAGTKAATNLDTKFQEYLGNNLEKFNQLPAAKQQALKSAWMESATKSGLLSPATQATTPAVGGSGLQGLPGSGAPAPAKTVSGAAARDEQMLKLAQDTTASPQAREQAAAYVNVKRMYANPKFADERKAFQQAERNWVKSEASFFKNHLNRKDPRYKDRYRDYKNFQKGDARTKLMVYTELLKHPRFASLGYK